MPTPTSGGARSPEVIVSRRFAFRVAQLLLSAYRFLAFPPWEVAARFLPFFPAGFFLAGFLSLPLLLLLLLPLVARFLPFLARPFFFAAFWLPLLPSYGVKTKTWRIIGYMPRSALGFGTPSGSAPLHFITRLRGRLLLCDSMALVSMSFSRSLS